VREPIRVHTGSTPWIVERSSPESSKLALQYQTLRGREIESSVERIDISETAESVRIALVQTIRRAHGPHSWVEGSDWVEAQLDAPLGSRSLLHAPIAPEFADLVPIPPPTL
jgi:hypothetical protein